MRINTNVASMTAMEANVQVNKNLSNSLEKLSSGLRINKAADDASGMAIADKLRTQASSLGQSISNANSGNALVQIADKAMAEQSNILDIVKTKLIQASTSTTSTEGREAIRKDINKLLEQLDNIASQTNYNGINLLNKANREFSFQVGEFENNNIGFTTAYAANTSGLGGGNSTYSVGALADLVNTNETVSVKLGTAASSGEHIVISGQKNTAGVGDKADATVEISASSVKTMELVASAGGQAAVTLKTTDADTISVLEALADSVPALTKVATGEYTFKATAASQTATLDFGNGIDLANLEVSGLEMGTASGMGEALQLTTDDVVSVKRTDQNTDLVNESTLNLRVDSETSGELVGGKLLSELKDLQPDELTSAVANSFIGAIEEALNQINTVRSDFGSTQNQLDSFIRNAMTTQTNIKAAESIIRDVDYAAESSNFNKQNIIAQAGTYAMSQANNVQQNVLKLLQ